MIDPVLILEVFESDRMLILETFASDRILMAEAYATDPRLMVEAYAADLFEIVVVMLIVHVVKMVLTVELVIEDLAILCICLRTIWLVDCIVPFDYLDTDAADR